MALLKFGKQIMGVSRSHQPLPLGFWRYLTLSKTTHRHRLLCASYTTSVNSDNTTTTNNESKPLISLKGFFYYSLRKLLSPPVPPVPTRVQVMMRNIMVKIKSCPGENPPVDEIRPLYHDLLRKFDDYGMVYVLMAFSRLEVLRWKPSPSIDGFQDLVANLPTNMIPLFEDMTIEVFKEEYHHILNRDIKVLAEPSSLCVVADLYHIGNRRLKVFVIGDHLVVVGKDRDDDPKVNTNDSLLNQAPKQMVKIPPFPYLHDKITASIVRGRLHVLFHHVDQSQVVNKPRIYMLNQRFTNSMFDD
ncbi:uncharacterized protein [Rutidosis leptorrhynchoides]|uniref:uncharacterized protein n=1 Tax=Rutidosis leptorrhynchoides TaxID=125765 RepID=UPI003A9A4DF8